MGNKEIISAVYPGSFDPITLGHVDIISRASYLVDSLVVAIAANSNKKSVFSPQERAVMVDKEIARLTKEGRIKAEVKVDIFEGLLVDFVQSKGIKFIIRGLRAVSDFENEFKMAAANRLIGTAETMFMIASPEHQFTSAGMAKEILAHGGRVSSFLSKDIELSLKPRLAQKRVNKTNPNSNR